MKVIVKVWLNVQGIKYIQVIKYSLIAASREACARLLLVKANAATCIEKN